MPDPLDLLVEVLRLQSNRAQESRRRASIPVDPETFLLAFWAFYGAAELASHHPSPHGRASSRRPSAKGAQTIPQPGPDVACLAAAHRTLVDAGVGDPVPYVVRLLTLDGVLANHYGDQTKLLEKLTLSGVGERELVRAAAKARVVSNNGRRIFLSSDLLPKDETSN